MRLFEVITFIVCVILIGGLLFGIAIGGAHAKKKECERAGGVWLPNNSQCLPKEK